MKPFSLLPLLCASLLLHFLLMLACPAWAELRTLTATGEYRMGDNDTRTDAKRLALQDAKRLALEQAGSYVESLTEVKNFQLSRDEVRAYTAGIVEVLEQQTHSTMDGDTVIVRVDVTCQIDTAAVALQIDRLRRNETVKVDLLQAQRDNERLRQENETLRQKLAAATTRPEIEALQAKRREALTDQDVTSLLAQAWVALAGSGENLMVGSSTREGRRRARQLVEQALALDPTDAQVHRRLGNLLHEEGDYAGAIAALHTALRLKPDLALAALTHNDLGLALQAHGDLSGAAAEYRLAVQLRPDFAAAHYNLGNALQANHDVQGALAEYRTAVRLEPNDAESHYNLGLALKDTGDLEGAMAEWRTAIRLKPDSAGAHFNLGFALKLQGQRAEAAQEFRAFLRIIGPNTPAYQPFIERAKTMLRELE